MTCGAAECDWVNTCTVYLFIIIISRKMVPTTKRASSFLEIFVCTYVRFQRQNRKEKEEKETEQQQTYKFTQGYNIFHRLQVHHLTLTFVIHNKYTNCKTACHNSI